MTGSDLYSRAKNLRYYRGSCSMKIRSIRCLRARNLCSASFHFSWLLMELLSIWGCPGRLDQLLNSNFSSWCMFSHQQLWSVYLLDCFAYMMTCVVKSGVFIRGDSWSIVLWSYNRHCLHLLAVGTLWRRQRTLYRLWQLQVIQRHACNCSDWQNHHDVFFLSGLVDPQIRG